MEELYELLKECCPGVDFDTQQRLIDDGILESLDIVTIVSELMEHYDIDIDVEDLVPENFNSVQAIYELIRGRQEEND